MIKPLKVENNNHYEGQDHTIGNINVYGTHHWLLQLKPSLMRRFRDLHPLPVTSFNANPWEGCVAAGIDIEALKKVMMTCPLTGWDYYPMVPFCILSDKPDKYIDKAFGWVQEMMGDKEWMQRIVFGDLGAEPMKDSLSIGEDELSRAHVFMLGTGYDACFLPSDGSNHLEWFVVKLDNNDYLLMAGWVWFNK